MQRLTQMHVNKTYLYFAFVFKLIMYVLFVKLYKGILSMENWNHCLRIWDIIYSRGPCLKYSLEVFFFNHVNIHGSNSTWLSLVVFECSLSFSFIFSNRKKLQMAKPGEQGGCRMTMILFAAKNACVVKALCCTIIIDFCEECHHAAINRLI